MIGKGAALAAAAGLFLSGTLRADGPDVQPVDEYPALVPPVDTSRPPVSTAHLDRIEKLPEVLRTPADARECVAVLWEDYGDPAANAQAHLAVAMGLSFVVSRDTPEEVRRVLRDGLVAYCQRGGLENVAECYTPWGREVARVLAAVTGPGDGEAQAVLLDLAYILASSPEERRVSAPEYSDGAARGAAAFGGRIEEVPAWQLGRDTALLARYREIFGDTLSKDEYAALEAALAGEMRSITRELLTQGAFQREFDAQAPSAEKGVALEGGGAPSGERSPSDADSAERHRALREELRLLIRHRGDADRVRRVGVLARSLAEQSRRQAVHEVLSAYRRVLQSRQPRAEQGVVDAVERELLEIPVAQLDVKGAAHWVRACVAVGSRASESFRESLAERERRAQSPHARKAYQEALRRLGSRDRP